MNAKTIMLGLSLATVTLVSACASRDKTTQITVAIGSETKIPTELDTLEVVVVASDGSEVHRLPHDVQNARFFPATLAIIPRDGESLDGPVTIEVRGGKGSQFAGQVFRRAVVSYVEGRTLLLPMPLRMACFNFRDCAQNETCAGGRCQPAQVDPAALADFDDARVFGELAADTCFDETKCFEGLALAPIAADCTFPLPADAAPRAPGATLQANVAIRWAAAPDRVIGLEGDDPVEGWTRVSDTRGLLSPGVCDSALDPEPDPALRRVPDKALDARVSTRCATKTAAQPYCRAADGSSGVGRQIN